MVGVVFSAFLHIVEPRVWKFCRAGSGSAMSTSISRIDACCSDCDTLPAHFTLCFECDDEVSNGWFYDGDVIDIELKGGHVHSKMLYSFIYKKDEWVKCE